MSLLKRFKNFGNYRAFVKCPNCGFSSEIKIPKGTSVNDFVAGGKCVCDSCKVVFYPDEYTTEHFEKAKNKELNVQIKAKPNKDYEVENAKFINLDEKEKKIKWF